MALLRRMDTSGIFCSLSFRFLDFPRRLSRTQGMVATMVLPDMSWVSHFSVSRFLFCFNADGVVSSPEMTIFRSSDGGRFDLNRGSHISSHVTGEGHMMVLGLDTRGFLFPCEWDQSVGPMKPSRVIQIGVFF